MASTFPALKFNAASRLNGSLLADAERRILMWLARRLPDSINHDQP